MAVVVGFCFMPGMVMIMGAVFSLVFMIMHVRCAAVSMVVFVFMKMLVNMRVRMFMRVFHLPVAMPVHMAVGMLMRVQMFVFMGSVHCKASFQGLYEALLGLNINYIIYRQADLSSINCILAQEKFKEIEIDKLLQLF